MRRSDVSEDLFDIIDPNESALRPSEVSDSRTTVPNDDLMYSQSLLTTKDDKVLTT